MIPEMVSGLDPRPIPRLVAVATEAPAVVVVTWQGGGTDRVDLSGWIAGGGPAFAVLTDPRTFAAAAVADFGGAIQWGDEDLSIDTVHLEMLAEQQRPFDREDLARWQARHHLSNQEAADLLGVRVSTWHNYKTGATRIPRATQIACRAIDRDSVLLAAHLRPRRPGRPAA